MKQSLIIIIPLLAPLLLAGTAVEDLVNNLACCAKTQYVQFHLLPYFSMSITQLKMRVYLL
jgi:hypothetical protein